MAKSKVPSDPEIYHITHVDNLPGILTEGGLWCDAKRIERSLESTNIGYQHIKSRRLSRPVDTTAGGSLGDYVPFNFCPRSVMLYVVSRGHQDYQGGQENILHLVSRVSVATQLEKPWAFTDRHAELAHALHFDDLAKLGEVPWDVMGLTQWSDKKELRQAEFLLYQFFPWTAIEEVVVMTSAMEAKVKQVLDGHEYQPSVRTCPAWYY